MGHPTDVASLWEAQALGWGRNVHPGLLVAQRLTGARQKWEGPHLCSPTLPPSRQAARASLEHVSPKHTHISTQKTLVSPCLAPHLSLPGRREGWRASNGDGGRFESEIGASGRGQGRRCQNGEPLQGRRRGREEAGRKMGARQASSPSSRLQKGKETGSRPGGRAPGGTGQTRARRHPALPHPPPQASKWRLAAAAARLCPGMGWGVAGRQGAKPNATSLGMVVASPQCRPHQPESRALMPGALRVEKEGGRAGTGGPADKARSPQAVGSSPRPYKDGAAWHCQGDGALVKINRPAPGKLNQGAQVEVPLWAASCPTPPPSAEWQG